MKLSTAIMLGSTTCKMVEGDWNSCALGCAANAMGIAQGERKTEIFNNIPHTFGFIMSDGRHRREHIDRIWPWLSGNYGRGLSFRSRVFLMFDERVCSGEMTLEQLVDYVRSIEPSCGDCCRFTCTCDKAASPESITEGVCVPS